jgi:mannose-6-phosphate isomerase-like protein (cupin superfamily)
MSSFTQKNLKDCDDMAAARGATDVEARMARQHLDSEHLGVSYFRYGPNVKAPFGHRHKVQEEAYVVVSGSGRMRIDDEIVDLSQWDVIRVAPEPVRGFQAGPEGLEMIIVGADRPPEGDGEMVADWWTEEPVAGA